MGCRRGLHDRATATKTAAAVIVGNICSLVADAKVCVCVCVCVGVGASITLHATVNACTLGPMFSVKRAHAMNGGNQSNTLLCHLL